MPQYPPKPMRIIKNMYSCCVGETNYGSWEGEWFGIEACVKQCEILSPLILNDMKQQRKYNDTKTQG